MDRPLIEEVFEKAGGRQALRAELKLSKQTMSDWVRSGEVPVIHCPAVQRLTGIPLEKLNQRFASEKA